MVSGWALVTERVTLDCKVRCVQMVGLPWLLLHRGTLEHSTWVNKVGQEVWPVTEPLVWLAEVGVMMW